MRIVATAIVLSPLTACVTRMPVPDPHGYASVRRVDGCGGTPVSDGPIRYTNVVLGDELSRKLLGLLSKQVSAPQCWHARSDGALELEAGPFCDPMVVAQFLEREGEWTLAAENYQPIVLCHERVR